MEYKEFTYKTSEIVINPNDITRLMGYKEDVPEMIFDTIASEIALIPESGEIKGAYIVLDALVNQEESTISIENVKFNLGKRVAKLYSETEQVAIFLCTAGEYISSRAKELTNTGELLEGYTVDIIGSTLVESAMDKIHLELKEEFKNTNITNRYSPGYGDWLVAEQQQLFSFFPKGICGISLSESALMEPSKSVSGFIGIGENVKYKKYSCDLCTLQECLYRHLNSCRKEIV